MTGSFAGALAESEEDQVVEWCGRCGFDPAMTVMLLEIHRDPDAEIAGEHCESGQPMRAMDWYMIHTGSIQRYVNYLLRIHAILCYRACDDPDQAAALRKMVEDSWLQNPGDP